MSRSQILLKSLETFYGDEKNSDILKDILSRTSGISLRNLEWFITNYSKKKNLTYKTKDGKIFTVHMSYKSSLDGYSKKLFDPFCRTERIDFDLADKTKIQTTVAQLNFIKWCITNGIIKYLVDNKTKLFNTNSKSEKVLSD